MKGIVGIVAAEGARYTRFWSDMQRLEAPDGVDIRIEYGGTLGMARNAIVMDFLQTDAQWLVMIDDDHAVDPLFLRKWLFRHERKLNAPLANPITASLYLLRSAPFTPTIFENVDGLPSAFSLLDFPTSGAVSHSLDGRPIFAAGASGMFVRRDVYERVPPPWYLLDEIGEDFHFCAKAQAAGFPVVVDLDSRLGHISPFIIYPDVINGEWVTSIRREPLAIAIEAAESKVRV